jgi:hypothetical protein
MNVFLGVLALLAMIVGITILYVLVLLWWDSQIRKYR